MGVGSFEGCKSYLEGQWAGPGWGRGVIKEQKERSTKAEEKLGNNKPRARDKTEAGQRRCAVGSLRQRIRRAPLSPTSLRGLGFSVLQLRGWNSHQVSLKQALAYAVNPSFLSTYCVHSPVPGTEAHQMSPLPCKSSQ